MLRAVRQNARISAIVRDENTCDPGAQNERNWRSGATLRDDARDNTTKPPVGLEPTTSNGKGQRLVTLGASTTGKGMVGVFDPSGIRAAGLLTTRP